MFQATLSSSQVFRKIIDSLKDLVSEVNLEATIQGKKSNILLYLLLILLIILGLSLQAMDSAHVSLVSLKINDSGFAEYRCDKNITLGINLVELSKILKLAKAEDTLILKAEEDSSSLSINFENQKSGKVAEFQLNLLNLDIQALGIPDTEYSTYIKMSSNEFVSLCKDFTSLSDSVKIEVQNDIASFSIVGKSGQGKITLKNNNAEKNEDQISIICREEVCCTYGLQYLNSFAKASSLSEIVTINVSSKFPLMIEYEIEAMGSIKFYLAPKMDDENND